MIEINGLVAGVQTVGADTGGHPFRAGVGTVGTHIRHAGAFAVHIPCTLELIGSAGTAPQKIITENAHFILPYNSAAEIPNVF